MSVVGFASVRGAPGVTTLSLLVASAFGGSAGLVEADLSGATLAVHYGLGREPGITTLAASRVGDAADWRTHAQLAGGVPVLVGPDSPQSATALWHRAGPTLGRDLARADATLVADLGRVGDGHPLLDNLASLVVVARPVVEHLVTLAHRLPAFRQSTPQLGVVLVGEGEYRPADVTEQLEVHVLGVVPSDPRSAAALAGVDAARRLGRGPLVRAAAAVAGEVETMLSELAAAHGVTQP